MREREKGVKGRELGERVREGDGGGERERGKERETETERGRGREREEITSKGRDRVTRVWVYHFFKIMLGFLYLYCF